MEYSAFNGSDDEGQQVTPMPQEALHNNSHESPEKDAMPYGNDPMDKGDYGTDYYLDTQRSCNINRQKQSNKCVAATNNDTTIAEKKQYTLDDVNDYDLSIMDMDMEGDASEDMDQKDFGVVGSSERIVNPIMGMISEVLILFSVIFSVYILSKTTLFSSYNKDDINFVLIKSIITAFIILFVQNL